MSGVKLSDQRWGVRSSRSSGLPARIACPKPTYNEPEPDIGGTQPQWRYPLVGTNPTKDVFGHSEDKSPEEQAYFETHYWAQKAAQEQQRNQDFDKALKNRLKSISNRKRRMFVDTATRAHDRDERTVNTSLHESIHVVAPVVVRGDAGNLDHSILKSVNRGGGAVNGELLDTSQHTNATVASVHDLTQFARDRLLSRSSHSSSENERNGHNHRQQDDSIAPIPNIGNSDDDEDDDNDNDFPDDDNNNNTDDASQSRSQREAPLFEVAGYTMVPQPLQDDHDMETIPPTIQDPQNSTQPTASFSVDMRSNAADEEKHTLYCTQVFAQQELLEEKRQAKAALALRRKLFMSIERERARMYKLTRDHQSRSDNARTAKEEERVQAESHLEHLKPVVVNGDPTADLMRELQLEESIIHAELQQRKVELDRFSIALKAQLQEKCLNNKVAFQSPNCCSGMESYGQCANNCAFYNNKRRFVKHLTGI